MSTPKFIAIKGLTSMNPTSYNLFEQLLLPFQVFPDTLSDHWVFPPYFYFSHSPIPSPSSLNMILEEHGSSSDTLYQLLFTLSLSFLPQSTALMLNPIIWMYGPPFLKGLENELPYF